MEVFHPNDTFQFDQLQLTHPNSIAGGSYMTRYSYFNSKQPLYIQTTKTCSKQGIVVSGKKAYIDLLVTSSDVDSEMTEWIANLEKRSVDLLYEKRHLWFTQELDRDDIENSFTSPIRAYKTGHFLVRVNLEPNRNFTHIQPFSCKVFDENKRSAPVEYIKDKHTIISIIEFQGIKFTSRNFQMELILRQVLVIPDVPLFETCIISEPAPAPAPAPAPMRPAAAHEKNPAQCAVDDADVDAVDPEDEQEERTEQNALASVYLGREPEPEPPREIKHFDFKEIEIDFDSIPDTIDTNEPNFQTPATATTATATATTATATATAAATTTATVSTIKLKKHKDVLYEMYKVAKRKAQEAKKVAIRTYLEAKEIKAAYLLDNSDLSDSDNDD
jgi:hypothetical protein